MSKTNDLNVDMISITPLDSIGENKITFRSKSLDDFNKSRTHTKIQLQNNSDHIVSFRIKFRQQAYYCVQFSHYIILEPGQKKIWNGKFSYLQFIRGVILIYFKKLFFK